MEIKKLGYWIYTQQHNYKNNLDIMSNKNIIKLWEEFKNNVKYKKYFQSNTENWKEKLSEVKKYIDKTKKSHQILIKK